MIEIYGVPNTWDSCLYIILQKGFNVSILSKLECSNGHSKIVYLAEKYNNQFIANDYLSLLGAIRTWEIFGDDVLNMEEEGKELEVKIPQEIYYFEEDVE